MLMTHCRVILNIGQYRPGRLADGAVLVHAAHGDRIKPGRIQRLRITGRERFIVLCINVALHPPLVVPHTPAQTEPAGQA
ncbi:hypothetical protein D3C73_1104880 [compost metagenome]